MAMTQAHHAPPSAGAAQAPRGAIAPHAVAADLLFAAGVHRGRDLGRLCAVAALAGAPVALDAPSLPITVDGVTFNIPPAAIRNKVQRQPGTQERVDLAFLWPSLMPPDPRVKAPTARRSTQGDRAGVRHHRGRDGTLPPLERFKTIYPRYLEPQHRDRRRTACTLQAVPRRHALSGRGPDLRPPRPERFLVALHARRASGRQSASCLFERRIGRPTSPSRFPRDWLSRLARRSSQPASTG